MKLSFALRVAAVAGLAGIAAIRRPLASQAPVRVPWAAGESLEYSVKLSGITSGSGIMQVLALDTMRGHPTWRLHFNIKGSVPLGLYHVDDSYDSWMDIFTLNSLRFEQNLYEGGKKTKRVNNIFPDRMMFHREGRDEEPSVANPLDDASFFFFIRTVPLVVGETYTFDQYFEPKANPVVIKVIRKDTIDVPAGRFPAIVIDPRIKTNGLFSKDGHAEIWLSDDSRRIMLKMHSSFSVITLDLSLKKATYGGTSNGGAAPEQH